MKLVNHPGLAAGYFYALKYLLMDIIIDKISIKGYNLNEKYSFRRFGRLGVIIEEMQKRRKELGLT